MRTRLLLSVLAVMSCGKKPAATTPVTSAPPAAKTSLTSCADVGVLLSAVADDGTGTRRTDHAKDIERACSKGHWPRKMVDCIGASTGDDINACIEKLNENQQIVWNQLQAKWAQEIDAAAMYGGQYGYQYPQVVGVTGDVRAPVVIDCTSAIGDAGRFPPAVGPTDGDRSFTDALRTWSLNQSCGTSWPDTLKSCLTNAAGADEVKTCMTTFAEVSKDISARVIAMDALMKRTKERRRGGDMSCSAAVATHYADANWKGKAPQTTKPEERRKMMADSRTKMTKACSDESWSDDLRSCIAADGGDACFAAAGVPNSWSYPAGGVFGSTGIPECDAYASELVKMQTCTGIPQATRDALKQSLESGLDMFKNIPPDQRPMYVDTCRQWVQSVKNMEMSAGCTP